ncbi:DUF654-domain-containing protein [Atractiella rhizophila]|nr:DUF654-domain-containing protein [Atractiella rhizophila]
MVRLSKRQLREKNDLELLGGELGSESSEKEVQVASSSKFAMLNEGTSEEEEEEDPEPAAKSTSRKKKKKKKKPAVSSSGGAGEDPSTPATVDTPPVGGATKPKKKKGKVKKDTASKVDEDEGLDEIDRALKELAATDTKPSTTSTSKPSLPPVVLSTAFRSLLSVQAQFLDSDAELRRIFGKGVVATVQPSTALGNHPRIANNVHHRAVHSSRLNLAKPEAGWPPFHRVKTGLDMEVVAADGGETWFSFVHSKAYRETTYLFLEAVSSMDPNRLMGILSIYPYHTDTLLQLSEVGAQQGDPGLQASFLAKALHAFESASLPSFNFSTGTSRLVFEDIENRGFFKAAQKKIEICAKRGTWRTAFEWCKLLLSMDPYNDPYGALLHIDFLAVKARQYQYLINLAEELPKAQIAHQERVGYGHVLGLQFFPGMAFGVALATFHLEREAKKEPEESKKLLISAILKFPFVLKLLSSKLGFSLPPLVTQNARSHVESRYTPIPIYPMHLMAYLYVQRSEPLWKEADSLQFLQDMASAAAHHIDDKTHPDVIFGQKLVDGEEGFPKDSVPGGIIRNAFVSDIPTIRSFLPSSVLSSSSFSFDPLPPPDARTYDDDYFSSVFASGARRGGSRTIERIQNVVRRRLEEFLQEQEGLDGVDEETLARIREELERMGVEGREHGAAVAERARGRGEVPGGFEVSDESNDEGGDAAGQDQGAGFMGMLGRLGGWFGGRG